MANVDAFNSGVDIGLGSTKKGRQKLSAQKGKQKDDSSSESSADKTIKIGDFNKGNTSAVPSSYKKGGKVKKTGLAKVHKGEKVLTVAQQKKASLKKGKRKSIAHKRIAGKR
jgi:hypothetical protein